MLNCRRMSTSLKLHCHYLKALLILALSMQTIAGLERVRILNNKYNGIEDNYVSLNSEMMFFGDASSDGYNWNCDSDGNCNLKIDSTFSIFLNEGYRLQLLLNDTSKNINGGISIKVSNVKWEVDNSFKYFHVRGVEYGRYGSNYYSCDGDVYKTCGTGTTSYFVNGLGETLDSQDYVVVAFRDSKSFRTDIANAYIWPTSNQCACNPGYDDVWFCIERAMTYSTDEDYIAVSNIGGVDRFSADIEIDAFGKKYDSKLTSSVTDDMEVDIPGFGSITIYGFSESRHALEGKFLLRRIQVRQDENKKFSIKHIESYLADSAPELGVIPSEGLGKYQLVYIGSDDLVFDKSVVHNFNYYECDRNYEGEHLSSGNRLIDSINNLVSPATNVMRSIGTSVADRGQKLKSGRQCCIQIMSSSKKEIDVILSNYDKFSDKTNIYGLIDSSISRVSLNGKNTLGEDTILFNNLMKQSTQIKIVSNDINIKAKTSYAEITDIELLNCTVFTSSTGSFLRINVTENSSEEGKRMKIWSKDAVLSVNYITLRKSGNNTINIMITPKSNASEYEFCGGENNVCRRVPVNYVSPNAGGSDDPDDNSGKGPQPDGIGFVDFISYMYTGIISSIVVTLVFLIDFILGAILLFASWKTMKRTILLLLFIFSCGKYSVNVDAVTYEYAQDLLNITKMTRTSTGDACGVSSYIDPDKIALEIQGILYETKPYIIVSYKDFMRGQEFNELFSYSFLQSKNYNRTSADIASYYFDFRNGYAQTHIDYEVSGSNHKGSFKNLILDGAGNTLNGFRFYSSQEYINERSIQYNHRFENNTDAEERLSDYYLYFYDFESILARFKNIILKYKLKCNNLESEVSMYTVHAVPKVFHEYVGDDEYFTQSHLEKKILFPKNSAVIGSQITSVNTRKIEESEFVEIIVGYSIGVEDSMIDDLIKSSISISGAATIICSSVINETRSESSEARRSGVVRCVILCTGRCSVRTSSGSYTIRSENRPILKKDYKMNEFLIRNKRNGTFISNNKISKYTMTILGDFKTEMIRENYKIGKKNIDQVGYYISNGVEYNMAVDRIKSNMLSIREKLKLQKEHELDHNKRVREVIMENDLDKFNKMRRDSRYRKIIEDNVGYSIEDSFGIVNGNILKVESGNHFEVQCDPTNGETIICSNNFGLFILNNSNHQYIRKIEVATKYNMEAIIILPRKMEPIGLKFSDDNEFGRLYWDNEGGISCFDGICLAKSNITSSFRLLESNAARNHRLDMGNNGISSGRLSENHVTEYDPNSGFISKLLYTETGCNRCNFKCMMNCARSNMTKSYNWFFWSPLYVVGFIMGWILIVNLFYLIVVSGVKSGSKSFIRGGYSKFKKLGYNIADGKVTDYIPFINKRSQLERRDVRYTKMARRNNRYSNTFGGGDREYKSIAND